MKKNLITSAIFLTLSTAALANETTEQVAQLDEIKVYSAYAAPVNQDKTASSVTVLTEKDFAQRNATYVSDVLKTVPGVAMGSYGGRGTLASLFLRGADSKQAAVIIDGVKVNPMDGDGYDFGGLSLSNVERIEVLRGEQSALYGSDAIGGVIYITTKSGLYKDKGFNVDLDFGGGSNKTSDGSVTISGHNNGFYYALHGSSHHTRSISAISSDVFRYTSVTGTEFTTGGAVEKDKFHSDKISAKFGYDDGNKGGEIVASHNSKVIHFDETYKRNETDYDDRTRSRETMFKLSGYLGNDQELFKHRISASHIKTDMDTFSTSLIYEAKNVIGFYPDISTADGKRLNTNYQLDINFDREGVITQSFSILGEYQRSEYTSSNFSGEKDKKLTERAIAAEYRLFHENDHSLSVSGRYVDHSQIKSDVVGRVSAGFRISPNFRLHGSFGTALRNPTMIDYFGYSGSYLANPALKPEQSKGGDLGLLIESSDKQHSLDLVYFARNVKNLITTNSTWTQSINLEETTKIKGVEVVYNGKFTDTLSGFANYTYTSTKDNKGLQLDRRPKHQANAGIHFQATDKLGTQASLSYVGKRIDTYPQRTKMPSYTLVNLGADYQLTSNLNAYVNLNNVFNKKYENILGYGQYGRNVYVGLKGSF